MSQSAHAQYCVVRRRVKCQQDERVRTGGATCAGVCSKEQNKFVSCRPRNVSSTRTFKKNVSRTRKFSLRLDMCRFV